MSDVTQLVRAALDAGVELRFVDGKLKATGKRKAVESWAPRLAASKAALLEALRPAEAPPTDWKPIAAEYHQHHFACATCIAAGKGYGLRCGTGSALWSAYQSEAVPTTQKEGNP